MLREHFGKKVPVAVSSAYIGGCLSFDYPLTFDEALNDGESYTSKAIGELIKMNDASSRSGHTFSSFCVREC